ncbi:MAG: serine/threonine protein kinase [Candidatus Melainabacteria bacterium]|nr:serine/threonine protein kinase [Candidatus Melainabacteria bacterium]
MKDIQAIVASHKLYAPKQSVAGKETELITLGQTIEYVPYKKCDGDSPRDELIEKAWKLKSSSIGRASCKPNKVILDGISIGEFISGKYRINEFIGSGGLGVIYSATDKDGNKVAIKALKGGEIPEVLMQRFLREASVMAFLDHKNIVSLIDVGVDKDRPYIVMEYVGNGTFMDVVKLYHKGYIDLSTALHYIADLCQALDIVHADGRFVHRDLSPANILLSSETTNSMDRRVERNVIKLADFGLTHVSDASKMLTDFGQIMGTVRFSPVIDMVGGNIDARSDLYSVGILLYYLVTKELPFDDPEGGDSHKGVISICDQHLYKSPDFDLIDKRLPSTLVWLMKKLLEKNPDNRPQKAKEVESMLREIAVGLAASTSLIVTPMFNPQAEIFTGQKEDNELTV